MDDEQPEPQEQGFERKQVPYLTAASWPYSFHGSALHGKRSGEWGGDSLKGRDLDTGWTVETYYFSEFL